MPDGWAWARLRDICSMFAGKSKPTSEIKDVAFENSFPCYGGNGIRGYVDTYSYDGIYSIVGRQGALCGNVNIANGKFYATEHAVVVTLFNGIDFLWSNYILHGLKLNNYATGAAQPGLSVANVLNVLVAIPPRSEQIKISKQIEYTLKYIDSIKKNEDGLHLVVESIKSKILDLAIRGKLVPQNPDDEPASVLLERIKAEKEELIKQGKIKRDKKESVIFKGEDNSYYADLPSGWCVSTLGNLTTSSCLNDGDWILSDNMVKFGNIKLIQLGSVGFMRYIDKSFKYLTDETFEELGCTEIHSGYLLINRIVSDKMSACILPKIEGKKITTVDTCWISPCDDWYNLKYILYAISSPQFQSSVMLNSSGTTRKRISKLNLISLPLAIPPLAEQKRIVDAIETAFEHIDNILNNL